MFLISKSGSGTTTSKLQPASGPPLFDVTTNSMLYVPGRASEAAVTLIEASAEEAPVPLVPTKLLPLLNPAERVQKPVSAPVVLEAVTVNA